MVASLPPPPTESRIITAPSSSLIKAEISYYYLLVALRMGGAFHTIYPSFRHHERKQVLVQ